MSTVSYSAPAPPTPANIDYRDLRLD